MPGQPQKVDKIEMTIGKEGTIELPVIHEHTTPAPSPTPLTAVAVPAKQQTTGAIPVTFKPRKFSQFKATKWEPTDSELSDQETTTGTASSSRYYGERKQTFKSNSGSKLNAASAQAEERSPSPCSISPSPEPRGNTAGRKQP